MLPNYNVFVMKFPYDFKNKILDFEHPPKVRTLFIIDFLCIVVILIVYALMQHVLPSNIMSDNTNLNDPTVTVEGPIDVAYPADETSADEKPPSKFADKFSDSITLSSRLYKSPNVSVEIEEFSSETPSFQHWYIADIYIRDIRCIQTFTSQNAGSNFFPAYPITELSKKANSVIAINGDFALVNNLGLVVRNGQLLCDKPSLSDICVLYNDGSMECFSSDKINVNEEIAKGVWQAWSFGPSLIDCNGKATTDFSSYYANLLSCHPRTILGYYEPGHYCFVVIDGRQGGYAIGMSMQDISNLMEELGCKAAFNLDGGQSSQMTFGSTIVNRPIGGGRALSDIIYIKDFYEEDAG